MLFVVLYFDYETKQTTIQPTKQTYTHEDIYFFGESHEFTHENKSNSTNVMTHTHVNTNPTMNTNKTSKQRDRQIKYTYFC